MCLGFAVEKLVEVLDVEFGMQRLWLGFWLHDVV